MLSLLHFDFAAFMSLLRALASMAYLWTDAVLVESGSVRLMTRGQLSIHVRVLYTTISKPLPPRFYLQQPCFPAHLEDLLQGEL